MHSPSRANLVHLRTGKSSVYTHFLYMCQISCTKAVLLAAEIPRSYFFSVNESFALICDALVSHHADNALVADYAPKTEVIQTLARYVSDLTLTGEEGIGFCRLPERKIPHGFHLTYRRCSKRSVYEISRGFTTILSKENSWRSDGLNKESRESV